MEVTKDINRTQVVLAEKKWADKWLVEQLGKNLATVSKWYKNASNLLQIAKVLEVYVKEVLNSSLEGSVHMVRLVK